MDFFLGVQLHFTINQNFIVYYLICEDEKTVWITAVVYGRRDQINALRDMPL